LVEEVITPNEVLLGADDGFDLILPETTKIEQSATTASQSTNDQSSNLSGGNP